MTQHLAPMCNNRIGMKMTKKNTHSHGIAGEQLKTIIRRIEKLEEEKAALAADIRDVFAEAKGNGFDVKTIRQVLKLRKLDSAERDEQDTLLNIYLNALGMASDVLDPEE